MRRLTTVAAAAAALALTTLGTALPAQAAVPDQVWLSGVSSGIGGATTSNTLTFSDGSTATQTLTDHAGNGCLPGAQQAAPVGETNPYYTPAVPTGTPFEGMSCAGKNSFTTTVTFAKPVSNPRLHIVNLDGSSLTIDGSSTTGAAIDAQKASGNNALTLTGNTVNPSPLGVGYSGCEANNGSHQYGQCGTVVLTTTSGAIKSFTLQNVSVLGSDGWAVSYSFPAPPTADNDTATTDADTPTTLSPADNDTAAGSATIDPSSVRLLDGTSPVTTLTNDDGTYTVDTATGDVTFAPASGFSGTAAPVTYQVNDSDGSVATATITVTVAPVVGSPMANPGVLAGLVLVTGLACCGAVWLRRRRATV